MPNRDELTSLIECVDELVEESVSQEYVLLNGERVKHGSRAHVKDIENSIKDLERRRNGEKRGSAARDSYARAISRLKAQLKKAIVAAEKMKRNLGISR